MLTFAPWLVSLAALTPMVSAELQESLPTPTVPVRPEPRELAPAPLRPGPLQRWTLATVMRKVEAEHPRIRSLQAERPVLAAKVLAARTSIPNPILLSDNGTAESTYRLGLTQTLELGGKRRRRVDVAEAQIGVHEAELRILAASLRAEARRTY
ncbi:MAG TPA: TolC family protein, partial [Nannocystis sp.]